MINFLFLFNILPMFYTQYEDFLGDYESGLSPLLSEKNEITILKQKLAVLNDNLKSSIQEEIDQIIPIQKHYLENLINKTEEHLNIKLINFSNNSYKNIKELKDNISYLLMTNDEIFQSINKFKNYSNECKEIEKEIVNKVNKRNVQYEGKFEKLTQYINDTIIPFVEDVNFNFLDNNTFQLIKNKIETVDKNTDEIFTIKSKLNEIDKFTNSNLSNITIENNIKIDLIRKNLSYLFELNSKIEDLIGNNLNIKVNNLSLTLDQFKKHSSLIKKENDYKINWLLQNLTYLHHSSYDFEKQIENNVDHIKRDFGLRLENLLNNSDKQLENRTNSKFEDFTKLIESVNNTLVTSVDKIKFNLNDTSNQIVKLNEMFNTFDQFKNHLSLIKKENDYKINWLLQNLTYLHHTSYEFEKQIKNNVNHIKSDFGLRLDELHKDLFNYSNLNYMKIELLRKNFTYELQLNFNLNKQLENKTDTKFKDFTRLIESINNTLVKSIEEIRFNLNATSNQIVKLDEKYTDDILAMPDKVSTALKDGFFPFLVEAFVLKRDFNEIHETISNNTKEIKNFEDQFQNLINKTRFNFTKQERSLDICKIHYTILNETVINLTKNYKVMENFEKKLSEILYRLMKVEKDIVMMNLEKTKINSEMLETSRTFLGNRFEKKFESLNSRLSSIERAIQIQSSTKKPFG